MTAPPLPGRVRTLRRREVARTTALLEEGWGGRLAPDADAALRALYHQFPLDAIDRGELDRMHVWPAGRPSGALYAVAAGTLMPVGDAEAGAALADAAERMGWRVLLGSPAICDALIDASPRGTRRRVRARDQQVMAITPALARATPALPAPAGFRPARRDDVDLLAEFACELHVEDQMGPSVPRSSRSAIWGRMLDSVLRGGTWVVERGGAPVAKLDLSLRSGVRGAQVAGVYVIPSHRGDGIASAAVHHLSRQLFAQGLPGVTLHVRADNEPGRRAYLRAGLRDIGTYRLALR